MPEEVIEQATAAPGERRSLLLQTSMDAQRAAAEALLAACDGSKMLAKAVIEAVAHD